MLRLAVFSFILTLVIAGCSSKQNWNDYKDGTHLIIEATKTDNGDPDNLQNTIHILRRRLHEYGVKNYLLKIEDKNRFSLQFPRRLKLSGPLYSLILRPYKLEFKLLNEKYHMDGGLPENLPQDSEILYSIDKPDETKIPYVVFKEALLTGNYIMNAEVQFSKYSERPEVVFDFNEEGTKIFERITAMNIKKRLAIILDNSVHSAPRIQTRISEGSAVLTGYFSDEDAKIFAVALKHGPYPTELKLISESSITEESWIGNEVSPEK